MGKCRESDNCGGAEKVPESHQHLQRILAEDRGDDKGLCLTL